MKNIQSKVTVNRENLLYSSGRLENSRAMDHKNSLIVLASVGILIAFLYTFTASIVAQNIDNEPEAIEPIDSIDSLEQTSNKNDSNASPAEQNGKDDDKFNIMITFPIVTHSFQYSLHNYPSRISNDDDYYDGGIDIEIGRFSGLMAHIGFRYSQEILRNTHYNGDEYSENGNNSNSPRDSYFGRENRTVSMAIIGFGKYFRFGKKTYKKHALMVGVGWAVRSYTLSGYINRVDANGRQYQTLYIRDQIYNPYGIYLRTGYYFLSRKYFVMSLTLEGYHTLAGDDPVYSHRGDSLFHSTSLNFAIGAHF